MKLKISTIVVGLAVILSIVFAVRYGFTVVTVEEAENTIKSEAFDPVAYVDGIWDSQIIPAFENGAVDLPLILSETEPDASGSISKDDLIPITEKYGLITVGEAHVFMVQGTGTITSVNTETSLGTAEVQIDNYDGPIKVNLYIGTRIPSDDTSVRDAVGFITFGSFKEQTEYGKASTEINKRVLSTVLADLDRESLVGKTIKFKGAYTIRTFNLLNIDLSEIFIVPVEIELGD